MKLPRNEAGLMQWAREFENVNNRVLRQTSVGYLFISTIFLGMDHSWGKGQPILFETMAWNNDAPEGMLQLSEDCPVRLVFPEVGELSRRHTTWAKALAWHQHCIDEAIKFYHDRGEGHPAIKEERMHRLVKATLTTAAHPTGPGLGDLAEPSDEAPHAGGVGDPPEKESGQ